LSRKKGGAQKTDKIKLIYNDKEIPEGSALYALVSRLAALGERETAGAAMVVEALLAAGSAGKRLVQIQAQLDRLEGRLVEYIRGGAVKAQEPPAPAPFVMAPAKPSGRPSRKAHKQAKTDVSRELAELEETVEQRQARMAKMEKDDKRKALALKKKQEELKAKEEAKEPETGTKAAPKKKRTRKRKKPAAKETVDQPT
jgi:hypothetical protein